MRKIDKTVDFHGYTSSEMVNELNRSLRSWLGVRRVRVIHGNGQALWRALRLWCREKAIPFETDPVNKGVTYLSPGLCPRLSSSPPHRPLTGLKRIARESELRSAEPKKDPAPSQDPMAEEFGRLSGEDARKLLGRKHSRGE
jgi:hypothetical protein